MSYHYQNSMSIVSFDARAKSIHIRVSKKTILILLSKNLISLFYQYILQLTQHPFFIHIIPNPNFFFILFLYLPLYLSLLPSNCYSTTYQNHPQPIPKTTKPPLQIQQTTENHHSPGKSKNNPINPYQTITTAPPTITTNLLKKPQSEQTPLCRANL